MRSTWHFTAKGFHQSLVKIWFSVGFHRYIFKTAAAWFGEKTTVDTRGMTWTASAGRSKRSCQDLTRCHGKHHEKNLLYVNHFIATSAMLNYQKAFNKNIELYYELIKNTLHRDAVQAVVQFPTVIDRGSGCLRSSWCWAWALRCRGRWCLGFSHPPLVPWVFNLCFGIWWSSFWMRWSSDSQASSIVMSSWCRHTYLQKQTARAMMSLRQK